MNFYQKEFLRKLLSAPVDWNKLKIIAFRHKTAPLLYWNLRSFENGVPSEILMNLKDYFSANATKNLHRTGQLLGLMDLFSENKIPVLPFKGPLLAAWVYGNLALRDFSDLDFLVMPEDASRAKALLLSVGFQSPRSFGPNHEKDYLDSHYAHSLMKPEDELHVELHWNLFPKYFGLDLKVGDLFARSILKEFGGRSIRGLSPEDLFLVLCIHASKHSWCRLLWVCDVAETLRAFPAMKWEEVFSRSENLEVNKMLHLGFLLARGILNVELPLEVDHALHANSGVKKLYFQVSGNLSCEDPKFKLSEDFWFRWELKSGPRHKINYALRFFFSPTTLDWEAFRLPALLSFLYYPLRIFRLIAKEGGRLFHTLANVKKHRN